MLVPGTKYILKDSSLLGEATYTLSYHPSGVYFLISDKGQFWESKGRAEISMIIELELNFLKAN